MSEYSTSKSCLYYKGYYLWNRDWLVRKCGVDSIAGIDDVAAAEVPCPPAKDAGKPLGESGDDLKAISEKTKEREPLPAAPRK